MLSKVSGVKPSTVFGSMGYQTSTGLSSNLMERTPTAQGPLSRNFSGPDGSKTVVVGVWVVVGECVVEGESDEEYRSHIQ